jgi:hypothetical protein
MVVSKVGEQCVVGFPPLGEFGPDAEVNRLVGGMGVENVGYPGTGDDDAGVAVPGGQYAQLLGQERRGIVRQRSVGPALVTGGRVPERAEDGDSLVSRTKVGSQLVDELQRVQDPDRHQGCVGVRVGDQGLDELGADLVEECPDRGDQDLQERPGGHVMNPPVRRDCLVPGPSLELDAARDGLEQLQ